MEFISGSSPLFSIDDVYLPRLGVTELLESRHTGKKTKTLLAILSHLTFFDNLCFKLGKRGHQLVEVSEAYSSQVCCCCGRRSPPGRSRRFACANHACRARLGRDENAAWNIALFALARLERFLADRVLAGRGACGRGGPSDEDVEMDDGEDGGEDPSTHDTLSPGGAHGAGVHSSKWH